jgi:hypothetical protein
VQTKLLHGIGDVGSSKHHVLESSCDAVEGRTLASPEGST